MNLPNTLSLNAFNVVPGVAFMGEGHEDEHLAQVWIAMTVERSNEGEKVYIWARRGDLVVEGPGQGIANMIFEKDYNDAVEVCGIVVNPLDLDDNDWGN